jgi:hypothetical protein
MSVGQTVAQRAKACGGTGPKTQTGRVRAARNARRHGLTLGVLADARRPAEVEALAQTIVADAGRGRTDLLALAQAIAEAQLDLARIRQTRHDLLALALSAERIEALVAIERYERRALSRRKFAIRDFVAARDQVAN